jgi:hypothetical protein
LVEEDEHEGDAETFVGESGRRSDGRRGRVDRGLSSYGGRNVAGRGCSGRPASSLASRTRSSDKDRWRSEFQISLGNLSLLIGAACSETVLVRKLGRFPPTTATLACIRTPKITRTGKAALSVPSN